MCWEDSDEAPPAGASVVGDGERFDADAVDCLDVDVCDCLVLGLRCPTAVMFLMRTTVRAAPQSTKAKVAPFHNFILEHGGALKFCGEKADSQTERQAGGQTTCSRSTVNPALQATEEARESSI